MKNKKIVLIEFKGEMVFSNSGIFDFSYFDL